MSTLTTRKYWLLLLFAAFAAGCSPMIKDGQPITSALTVPLESGHVIGQTFQARDAGLNGVAVSLSQGQGGGTIKLHLRDASTSSLDLAVATIPIEQVTAPTFYSFTFLPRNDSYKRSYYFLLELEGNGNVRVGTAPGDTFLDGALYQDGEAVDAQASFRLTYDPFGLALGLLQQGAAWLGVIAVAIFLYVLPGLALLTLLLRDAHQLAWGEKLGLAAGISIALYPLLLLWTHLVGLHLGALYAWLPSLGSLTFLIWRHRGTRLSALAVSLRQWRRSDSFLPDVTLIGLIVLVLFSRLWVIRSLDVPMWGDSYQHTMIAQLLVDNGGLFDSWEPYAEIQSFTYHFGFHSAVAAFHWISGADMPQATLWIGQIINVLAALALYPLAIQVGGNRWAGAGAVLVGGLLAPMPMFYVNWGRYTQLAGQVILPVAAILAWVVVESRTRDWRLIALTWIVWGGLALTHYRVLIFAMIFIVALALIYLGRQRTQTLISRILLVGLGSVILSLPWLIHTFAGKLPFFLGTQLITFPNATPPGVHEYSSAVDELATYLPMVVWVLLLLSTAWGFWRRDSAAVSITLWGGLVWLAANPQWLGLPGQAILSNFAIFIAAYIPAGVLVGAALGWLNANQFGRTKVVQVALTLLLLCVGLWGFSQRLADSHIKQHSLAAPADLRAATWIRKNTPANARFLVNSFFAYSGTIVVGSDGGWWLPLLAHRSTTLPPINYASETGPLPDYTEWINALTAAIQNKGIASPEVRAMVRERGITHIYVGQQQGRVNYSGPAVLNPEQLLSNPNFRAVYHQDRVWVFEIIS